MAANYHVYVGAETGIVKGLDVVKNKWDNLLDLKKVDRDNEVCAMTWLDGNEESILYGTRGGSIKELSIGSWEQKEVLQATHQQNEVLKGLSLYGSNYVTCSSHGQLQVWSRSECIDDQPSAVTNTVSINCGKDVCCMKADPCSSERVGIAGKENDLKVYDLSNPDVPVFKAKNVRDDWLDLRVPVWVTDFDFVLRPTSSLIVTCTAYHQIRLYDPSTSQRRPMIDMEWEQNPLTCLCVSSHNDRQLIVGNSIGEQTMIDLRNKQCVGKYKGGAGSIRCVQCHPTKSLVVSCGLDRYVRVHDLRTRALLNKFYMKSRLNKLLMHSNWSDDDDMASKEEQESVSVPVENDSDNNEDDQLWEKLDMVRDSENNTRLKRKRTLKVDAAKHELKQPSRRSKKNLVNG